MKKAISFFFLLSIFIASYSQVIDQRSETVDPGYFITRSRAEYIDKLSDLPLGIKKDDDVKTIISKIEKFLLNYKSNPSFKDDYYAWEANLQAFKSLKEGGYGIGAILIDSQGKIIARNYNKQLQESRSDLHGEMTLLTEFEESRAAKKYMNSYIYKPGLTVFSSAEPCPMCFIRLSTAGVDTKYCTPGPDDGMVTRISCLPPSWQELANKHKFEKAESAPVMQKIAHLLFYSFYLDNRGPK